MIALKDARAALSRNTGIVLPVYFPRGADRASAETLLADTVEGLRREVRSPGTICLSADGPGAGEETARRLAKEHHLALECSPRNRGKLAALRAGMRRLLENPRLRYLATVDQDADHFPNELVNFVRSAAHAQEAVPTDRVLVIGRRTSRHRPMGFLRGELEELADRILLDALAHHAAVSGKPLKLEFATALDEFPDFHSGYKLLTRPTAQAVFVREVDRAGLPEKACLRHAVEAVIAVEALLDGACLAAVTRSTINEQPVSAFGLLNRARMTADKILWPCKRLGVPPHFVDQWMRNHLPRLLLGTLVAQGRGELLDVRRAVRSALGLPTGEETFPRPPFV